MRRNPYFIGINSAMFFVTFEYKKQKVVAILILLELTLQLYFPINTHYLKT